MTVVECRCWVMAMDLGVMGMWNRVYDDQDAALSDYQFYRSRGQRCFFWEL